MNLQTRVQYTSESKRSSLLTFLQESKRSFCIVGNKNYIFCTKGEINSKIKQPKIIICERSAQM